MPFAQSAGNDATAAPEDDPVTFDTVVPFPGDRQRPILLAGLGRSDGNVEEPEFLAL